MRRLSPLPLLALLVLLCAPRSAAAKSETADNDDGPPRPAHTSPNEKGEDRVQQLPELVISSSRITALDVQIGKLTKKIDRARRRLKKSSSLDESLNTDDIPKLLSILGGYTTGQRKSLARERLMLMEAERSILEAMKHVRSYREEQELKTQLHTLKSMALLLEQS
ncbi:hypothetical protein AXK12_04270 [Cephaloticoccus capnophilus]|uniref:Uncharacterized protein n=1 Tax=Cephaloticoccus capnophilus TaxID=1548208 RepID=A0A139SN96_9BACT|nr:hypothetical protein [Cephaloticoccus capnophilus]KXU36045.1 hypothetical protein AXK12_04270 [Cephaloticoccus capnophilus]